MLTTSHRLQTNLAVAVAALLITAGQAGAWSQGPPADRVNLCSARLSCNDLGCHDSYPPNSGTAVSTLALSTGPLPATYKVGEILRIVLSVTDPDTSRQRFGFELGVVSDCPFAVAAGALVATDSGRTQIVTSGGLDFIEHVCTGAGSPTTCGYLPETVPGQNSWTFDWQAPAQGQGSVTFYWAINAADGNGLPDNDYVSLGLQTLDPNCPSRIETLQLVKVDCDSSSPGMPEIGLSWQAVAWANGYRSFRTSDPLALADPGGSGATLLSGAGTCDDPPTAPALHFYSVVGVCADASDGPS